LDNHLDRLVKDLEEKARNRNMEPSKNATQILPTSQSLPKIPLLLHHPAQTPREDPNVLGGRPALQREFQRNPPAAAAEFDNEGWLLVCDPELGLPLPSGFEQDATPEPSQKSSPFLDER
jgi:hypothetical protein